MNKISKHLISMAAAGILVAGPIAYIPAFAGQFGAGVQQDQNQNQDRDRDWNQYRDRDQDRDRDWNAGCDNYRDQRNRDDRCDSRKDWRDTRNNARWDDNRHNGYYTGNAWHYGPPQKRV
jgi:hypothetical protein